MSHLRSPVGFHEVTAAGQADCVLIARAFLSDPHWPLRAAGEPGVDVAWPVRYARAKRPG